MTLTRTVPLKRRRTKPRRIPELTCEIRTCHKPPRFFGWCALHARKEADRLFSLYIRKRDRRCQVKGCAHPYDLQCAHLVSRRYFATRWDTGDLFNPIGNAVGLCAYHHKLWTEDPLGWDDWCETKLGATQWRDLKWKARRGGMPDLGLVIGELRVLLEGVA